MTLPTRALGWPRPGRWSRQLLGALSAAGLLMASAGCAPGTTVATPAPLPAITPLPVNHSWDGGSLDPGESCTTVYATDGRQMLGGNNEDSSNR